MMPDESERSTEEIPTLIGEPPEPLDDALHAWFVDQQTKSVDNLESAARLIITLCTTLLAVFLGLMALTEEALPVYIEWSAVKWIAGLGVASLFVALIAALWAVFPQRTSTTLNDPDRLRVSFDKILKRKHGALITAIIFFGAAILDLVIVIGASIFSITP